MTPPSSAPARRASAVLVPLYRDESNVLRVVLLRRAAGGLHGGQIAFPGGTRDPGDASDRDTALREAHEEIGLEPSRVTILAELPPVETGTSNFRIAPFVGRIDRPPYWRPAFREVAEVLEPAVEDLARDEAQEEAVMSFGTWPEPRRVPFIRIGEHRLWGATHRILVPLLP